MIIVKILIIKIKILKMLAQLKYILRIMVYFNKICNIYNLKHNKTKNFNLCNKI